MQVCLLHEGNNVTNSSSVHAKYFSERLKERVYKYALRMANELHKSNTKCSKQ